MADSASGHDLAALRTQVERDLGPVQPEGDVRAELAALRPLLQPTETISIIFDPELDLAQVEVASPYSSMRSPGMSAGRTITQALRAAIDKRQAD